MDEAQDRLLSWADVIRMTGIAGGDVQAMIDAGTFPAPVATGLRKKLWSYLRVTAWNEDRVPAAAGTPAPPRPRRGQFVNEALLLSQAEPFDGQIRSATYLYRHVVKVADLAHGTSGIYFLWRGDTVVYVGQTKAGFSRIATHMASMRSFDGVSFIRCDIADLDRAERAYLDALLPEYNLDPTTVAARRAGERRKIKRRKPL